VSARLPPAGVRELGLVNWALCKLLSRGAGVPEAHLFTTLARQRGLFRAWLWFSGRLMPGGRLTRMDTECVILRVAQLRSCGYERDHHVRIGRRVGITPALLAAIEQGPDAAGLTPRQAALLAAVDDLVQQGNVSDPRWRALSPHLDAAQLVELCLLVGQYQMLATTIATLGIERDFAADG
jgi:AhpD family alkylhydroperoxidase